MPGTANARRVTIWRPHDSREIVTALTSGQRDNFPADGEAAAAPTADTAAPGTEVRALTRREREIAGLVADGLGNREIAERLYLSKRTVDSHLEHIFGKLGFSSRTQLTAWVLERREPA
jgi:DNA-binding NarL/FixJ family response regulator